MKKFHFYVGNCRPKAIICGSHLGDAIRGIWPFHLATFSWSTRNLGEPIAKVTLFLSQSKLPSMGTANIRGSVDLKRIGHKYSKRAIIRAIQECQCSAYFARTKPELYRWFARAKVERI